jgi:DNA-binding ferritin-like protein (Dps family)
MQNLIPAKFQTQYKQIQKLIYKYSDSDSDKIQYFVKMLSDLASNLDDTTNRDAILLQLQTFMENNK